MRKTKTVTIPNAPSSRDAGKVFQITEMSAYDAEAWANRAFLALANSSLDLPDNLRDTGMPGLIQVARLLGYVRFPELKPLMDELLDCVQIVPDPKKPFPRPLIRGQPEGDDVEEVSTYAMLREEVAALHVNFTLAANVLTLMARASSLSVDFGSAPTSPAASTP